MIKQDTQTGSDPAVIVIGGGAGGLSVVRSLARQGIPVYSLCYPHDPVRFSRYSRYIPFDGKMPARQAWAQFLTGTSSKHLRGAVLLACDDEAIQLILENYEALSSRYILEKSRPETRKAMLDKLSTYEKAREIGLSTPGYWFIKSRSELAERMNEFRFPMIVKPLFSPDFDKFNQKYLRADTQCELVKKFHQIDDLGIEFVLMEFIPGGDDKLCSYYTYRDEDGRRLVHFTKRIKRRFPVNMGGATYHVTDWIPEAAELGQRFFERIDLRGLGNIEFKRDPRDGQLKVIEVNARFTASVGLVAQSGVDLAVLTYDHLTGKSCAPIMDYEKDLVLWSPIEDFKAFLNLWQRNQITVAEWIGDISRTSQLMFFSWRDPGPSLFLIRQKLMRLLKRVFSGHRGQMIAAMKSSGLS
jgi:D-aspartate ligase